MLVDSAVGLCQRVQLPQDQLYRLVGVGLCNFQFDNEPGESMTPRYDLLQIPEAVLYSSE